MKFCLNERGPLVSTCFFSFIFFFIQWCIHTTPYHTLISFIGTVSVSFGQLNENLAYFCFQKFDKLILQQLILNTFSKLSSIFLLLWYVQISQKNNPCFELQPKHLFLGRDTKQYVPCLQVLFMCICICCIR